MDRNPDCIGTRMGNTVLQMRRNQEVVAHGKLKLTMRKFKGGISTYENDPLGPLLVIPESRFAGCSKGDDMLEPKLTVTQKS